MESLPASLAAPDARPDAELAPLAADPELLVAAPGDAAAAAAAAAPAGVPDAAEFCAAAIALAASPLCDDGVGEALPELGSLPAPSLAPMPSLLPRPVPSKAPESLLSLEPLDSLPSLVRFFFLDFLLDDDDEAVLEGEVELGAGGGACADGAVRCGRAGSCGL